MVKSCWSGCDRREVDGGSIAGVGVIEDFGIFLAKARFQDSDFCQKAIIMVTEMQFECNFAPFSI